jgi:hypothetical protein
MWRFLKFLLIAALAFLPLLSLAEPGRSQEPKPQEENTAQAAPQLTGHYEGAATNKEQQFIPLVINLRYVSGTFSGQINSSYGVFPITGGTRNDDSITIEFDASGTKGAISAKLSGDTFVGTFSVGDDSGS